MQTEVPPIVTVFGGTGFLGRRVVRHLLEKGIRVRVASRHRPSPARASGGRDPEWTLADVGDERSVATALEGACAAVNTVSLYVERGADTFHSVHVEGAHRVALQASRMGVKRLVHVSGIGSDSGSSSSYIRKRGEGEEVVRSSFAGALIMRPAVMFGPDDGFLTVILKLLHRLPVYPLFGRGDTRLQPVYVEDVGEAIARLLAGSLAVGETFECAGPRVYTFERLLKTVAGEAQLTTPLLPIPFAVWHALAAVAERLPHPPLTRNQVELMKVDNVRSPMVPGFEQLGIAPRPMEEVVRAMIHRRRNDNASLDLS